MNTAVRNCMAALMLLVPAVGAFVSTPAAAQHWNRVAQPTISSMTLDADHGLMSDSVLRARVNATPGANWASVTLGDSGIQVLLREQIPGTYSGSYAVRRFDRIDPMQLISVRLDYAGRLAAQNFSYPVAFQALASSSAQADTSEPMIERFVMRSSGGLERGRELRFRLVGTPGGDAWLDIPGVIRGIDLDEVRPGVYEGTYTIRRRDNLAAFPRAVATLQKGGHRSTSRVELRGFDVEPGYGYGGDERGPQITDLAPQHGDRITDRGRTVVTSHSNNAVVDADGFAIRGRTAPYANVQVQVESVANLAGLLGLSQPVADRSVQADRNGSFTVTVNPAALPIPGSRYDVRLTATSGSQSAEERFTLQPRRG